MPRYMRIGRLVGSTSPASAEFVSSNHAVPDQDYPLGGTSRGLVIGNVRSGDMYPAEVERALLYEQTEDELESYRGADPDVERPLSFTRRAFQRRNPAVISRAALRRQTGDPKWFMSSSAPPTSQGVDDDDLGELDDDDLDELVDAGALFIDTDGHRIQDGDDF